ncbi:hypothetical protein Tco_1332417 [Tanacetum coccineum]
MLQICPKLHGQHFVDPSFKEDILTFMRELGYPGTIKLLSDVKVEMLPQPWRTFATIINKCLSGKVTGINTLLYQIENKESRKNKYLYYPRFTKVIINHFMSQDQSIPRSNKVNWHMAKDDPILTTMRFIPQHEVVQKYGAILLDYLTNPTMKESEAYKTYYAFSTGKATPKPKYVRRTSKEKTEQAPKATSGKRLKATAKGAKSGKKKQPRFSSDEDDDEVRETKDDQDVSDDQDDVDDDDSERTKFDNKGDKFVHPKFTTHDEEDKEEESFDPRVHTPSQYESLDDEANDDVAQSGNAEEEELNAEHTNEEEEVNVNLEGRDA